MSLIGYGKKILCIIGFDCNALKKKPAWKAWIYIYIYIHIYIYMYIYMCVCVFVYEKIMKTGLQQIGIFLFVFRFGA